jgi:DNA-binding NarL/FixJ family response regulator
VEPATVRVLVVDSYEPWRRFVVLALRAKPHMQVVAEAGDGITAIQKVTELQPDIVILELCLPDAAGPEIAREILNLAPATTILFLTGVSSEAMVKDALSSGAHGYVLKSEAAQDLLPALEALLAKDYFVSLGAIRSSAPPDGPCFEKKRFNH